MSKEELIQELEIAYPVATLNNLSIATLEVLFNQLNS